MGATVDIVRYRPELAPDFARLNREWLERYFTIEPRDEAYLGDPEGLILAPGGGLGRALATTVVEFARERGARRVVLVSSSRLTPALRLYEAMGFQHRPFPGPPPYADADVYMELDLALRAP